MRSLAGSSGMALGCPDCPPPPTLDWRPPPDPAALFADLAIPWSQEDRQYAQCPLWETGLSPASGLGQSPMAFVVAAIAVFVLFTITAAFVVLCFKRSHKALLAQTYCNLRRRKSLEKSTGSSLMSSKSSGDSATHAAILPDAKDGLWSYSGLSRPPSHQNSRSNFGVFLYGAEGAESMRSNSVSRRSGPPAFATQGRRPPPSLPLQAAPSLHHTLSRPALVREAPLYEEIRAPYHAASLDHLQQHHRHLAYGSGAPQTQPRRGRCPPPTVKPPPPPVMVDAGAGSPLSSGSCSCSATSASLDQEMEAIRVTPSPRRASGHRSRDSLGGSGDRQLPDWADGSSSSGGGGGGGGPGRESGYGTDKRRRHHRSGSGIRPDPRTAILTHQPAHSMTYV